MKILLITVALLAFCAAATIALAGPGTRFGWWDYGTGLAVMRGMKVPAIILAGLAGVLTLVALVTGSGLAFLLLVATLAAGGAAMVPVKFEQLVGAYPLIHDITTDFDNPPAIVTGAKQPRKNSAAYVGAQKAPRSSLTIAEAQQKAFPDIEPMVLDISVDEAAKRAQSVIVDMNMDVLHVEPRGEATVIEAIFKSFWFGFIDDFVVRLTPEGQSTRVDVRSKSRVGLSDLGANAKRVREFFDQLRKRASRG
jgi:uncharacterized protein (DUF1499 family)